MENTVNAYGRHSWPSLECMRMAATSAATTLPARNAICRPFTPIPASTPSSRARQPHPSSGRKRLLLPAGSPHRREPRVPRRHFAPRRLLGIPARSGHGVKGRVDLHHLKLLGVPAQPASRRHVFGIPVPDESGIGSRGARIRVSE